MTTGAVQESLAAEEARRLYEEGLSVIPLGAPGERPPAWFRERCSSDAEASEKWPKTPRVKWSDYQHRQPTEAEIESWIRNWPTCNWAIVTGRQVNVVDADNAAAVAWIEGGGITRTPRKVVTAKGAHYYFQTSERVPVKNSANPHSKIDVRGFGGYVVAPGSIHATGVIYTEETIAGWGDTSWSELPVLTEADLLAIAGFNGLSHAPNGQMRPGPGNLNFDATTVAPITDPSDPVVGKGRNSATTRYTGKLIQEGMSLREIKALVDQFNGQHVDDAGNPSPLAEGELNTTIASTVATHLRNNPGATVPVEPKPVAKPGFMDLFDLVNDPADPPPYLIDGLFRQGDNVLLAGPPKSMKTFLMQDLLFGMAFGRPVLGFDVPAERRIAWIQAEMPIYETQRRAREHPWVQERMASGRPANLFVTDRSSTLAFNHQGVEAVIEMILQRFDGKAPDILAVDSLSSVYDRDSEDDNAKMQAFLRERLGRFREAFGEQLTIFVIHHTTKMNNATLRQDPFLAIRGASALRGWYSAGMILHRDPDSPESRMRHLHFELRGDQEPASMVLELRDGVMAPYVKAHVDVGSMIEVSACDAFLKLFDYHQRSTGAALHTANNKPETYAPKVLADLSAAYPKLAGKWSKVELAKGMHSLMNERGILEIFNSRDARGRGSAKTLRRRESPAKTTHQPTEEDRETHRGTMTQ